MWFQLLKTQSDFDAQANGFIRKILSCLTGRRADLGEKTVAYVESRTCALTNIYADNR